MTKEEAKDFCYMDSNKNGDIFVMHYTTVAKWIDKIYDDFEKELDKVKREFYIKGSNDCYDAMKASRDRNDD